MKKMMRTLWKSLFSTALGMFMVFPGNLGYNANDRIDYGHLLLAPARTAGVSENGDYYEDEQVALLIESGYLDGMASALVKVKELTALQKEKEEALKIAAEKAVLNEAEAERIAAIKAAEEKAAAERAAAERAAAKKAAAEKAAKKAAAEAAAKKAAQNPPVPSTPGTTNGQYTEEEMIMVARLIQAEAGGSSDGQKAVASVLYNRVKSSRFPNTVEGNIRKKSQFSVARDWDKFMSRSYSSTALANAKAVFLNGETTLPKTVLYFWSGSEVWGAKEFYAQIGGNYFFYG
ncbi:MAG: cell wall hydrolase [Christensenellales bacterium]